MLIYVLVEKFQHLGHRSLFIHDELVRNGQATAKLPLEKCNIPFAMSQLARVEPDVDEYQTPFPTR